MDRLIPLVAGGLLASLSYALYITLGYQRLKRMRGAIISAELDLLRDIDEIGPDELGKTESGRELLASLDPSQMLHYEDLHAVLVEQLVCLGVQRRQLRALQIERRELEEVIARFAETDNRSASESGCIDPT